MTQLSLHDGKQESDLQSAVHCLLNNLPEEKVRAASKALHHEAESVEEMIRLAQKKSSKSKGVFYSKLKKNIKNDPKHRLDLESVRRILKMHLPIEKNENGEITKNKNTHQNIRQWLRNVLYT